MRLRYNIKNPKRRSWEKFGTESSDDLKIITEIPKSNKKYMRKQEEEDRTKMTR